MTTEAEQILRDRQYMERPRTSPWVSIPAHALQGAAEDLSSALDYLSDGDIESARSCLVYPWTVLDTAQQAADDLYP